MEDTEMSTILALWMLVARPGQRMQRPPEVELAPIEPGAWAAWAKAQPAGVPSEAGREAGALVVGRSSRPPMLPRGIALRLRP
jgi:hypothetical protein